MSMRLTAWTMQARGNPSRPTKVLHLSRAAGAASRPGQSPRSQGTGDITVTSLL